MMTILEIIMETKKPGILWRLFYWFLIAVACSAILIALFYAGVNSSGKHAWEKYRQAMEAKGEKFSLKDFIPPEPPLDENFATTPVISSCYESLFDTTGHEVLPHRTNLVNRLKMPTTAEGAKNIPTNGYWFRGTLTDLAAWQSYYRQLAASTNLFPIPPAPQTPAADVLFALSIYDSTLEEVRAASLLPYAQFPLEYDRENPTEILIPHLASLKVLARLLQLRAIAELENAQSDKALKDVRLSLFLANSVRVEPFIISQLVRNAMTDITLQPIYEGLAEHRWTDLQLSALDAELARCDFLADFEYAMRGDRIYHISVLEYLRRTRNLAIFDDPDTANKPNPRGSLAFYLAPSGFFYQTEIYFSQMHDRWVFPIADTTLRIISPTKALEKEAAITNSLAQSAFQNHLASLLFPPVIAAARRFGRAQASIDLARVAIALERYRLAHGEFPDSLDPLTPQFINPIPHDIINGHPLNYHRTADGQFTLYSVAWNETDDGGVPGGPENSAIFHTGDLVWSYPAK